MTWSQVEDLGNLIKLYADWHSRLIPYYSFEQFVRKVEKLGAGNRVRVSYLLWFQTLIPCDCK
jgi:hypothetical protein